jgi:hypothetical protein
MASIKAKVLCTGVTTLEVGSKIVAMTPVYDPTITDWSASGPLGNFQMAAFPGSAALDAFVVGDYYLMTLDPSTAPVIPEVPAA